MPSLSNSFLPPRPFVARIQRFETNADRANRANLERYAEIKAGREGLMRRAMGELDGYGQATRSAIGSRFDALRGSATAGLAARGLSASTVAPTMAAGIESARAQSLASANERVAIRRADLLRMLGNDLYGFMERREDVAAPQYVGPRGF